MQVFGAALGARASSDRGPRRPSISNGEARCPRGLPGVLIAFEGIDGCGKSTQARLLRDELIARGHVVAIYREPGDTVPGRELRRIFVEGRNVTPFEEMQLFLEDRKIDVRDNILPSLAAGEVVLMDRYYLSSIVYQGSLGLDSEVIRTANEAFAPIPDLTLILDLEVATGRERIRRQRGTTNTFEAEASLLDAQRRYREYCGLPGF